MTKAKFLVAMAYTEGGRKRYRVVRRTFDTLDAALAYASLIFERTGLVVEIGEIRSTKGD